MVRTYESALPLEEIMERDPVLSAAGRVGGYRRAALYDGVAMTAKARHTFERSFLDGHACRLCPPVTIPENLPLVERERRAVALRKMHYANVALESVRVRQHRPKP